MRVAFVTQDFPPHVGGIQTYALRLAGELARSCDELVLLAPRVSGWREVDAKLDFEVIRVPSSVDMMPAGVTPFLIDLAVRRRFDLAFHAQWMTALASVQLLRLGALRSVGIAVHGRELFLGPEPGTRARAIYDRVRLRTFGAASAVFPVSRNTGRLTEQYGGVDPSRLHVINNGVDGQERQPASAEAVARWRASLGLGDRPVVASVGRLMPHKGFDRIIEAMPAVLKEVPGARYVVAGTGPDAGRLRRLAREHGVLDAVIFAGRVPYADLNALYTAADVFATISREQPPSIEGFGIVFLEASACGTPVVAGNSGGVPDAVADGESGILVDPASAPDVARALIHLLSNPAEARAMGERGRARALRDFSWSAVGENLAAKLRDTLEPTS